MRPIVAGAEPPAARPDGGPATPAAPSTAMAIAEPAKPAAKSSSFSLFSGLFGSKTADAKAADTPPAEPVVAEKKKSGTMDRVVRLVGLRKDKPLDTAADAWPKAKPAAKTVAAASSGAIKPKPADAEPVNAANVQAPAKPGAITPGPAPATTTAQATPGHGGERLGAGRTGRLLRHPLVGLPLTLHRSQMKTAGHARRFCFQAPGESRSPLGSLCRTDIERRPTRSASARLH